MTITYFFFIGNPACGKYYELDEYYKNIDSKNYPNSDYDNNLECYWIISVKDKNGTKPQITFEECTLASGDTVSVSC